MVIYNPQTGERYEEPNIYSIKLLEFDTKRLSRKDAEEFWRLMRACKWRNDNELFWLEGFDPVTGKIEPRGVTIESLNLPDRIGLLFEMISNLFPGIGAYAEMEYGGANYSMAVGDRGGNRTIKLSKGKVTFGGSSYS